MSNPPSRLRSILNHLLPASTQASTPPPHIHHLSPTFFLPRAASIEPNAQAIHHITSNGRPLRRSYAEFADRARGLAYYLTKHGFRRVGILATNTPAFLESIYGIAAAGAVSVPVNYRLSKEDVAYILGFAEVDCVVVDHEFEPLLETFRKDHADVHILVDWVRPPPSFLPRRSGQGFIGRLERSLTSCQDTDVSEGAQCGPFNEAVSEGLRYDLEQGSKNWAGLSAQCTHEDDTIAIPFTSGTTSRPKGVVYTHRGAYLASLANVIESNLNVDGGRCKYLWTLPM